VPDESAPVHLTPSATSKLKTLTKSRPIVRLFVAGETCCGYRYGLSLEDETTADDIVIDDDDVLLVVGREYREICAGAVVDFVQTTQGEGFTVRTPGSAAGCTCGRR
jgi:iron-sulfur cluster insertion protein